MNKRKYTTFSVFALRLISLRLLAQETRSSAQAALSQHESFLAYRTAEVEDVMARTALVPASARAQRTAVSQPVNMQIKE